LFLNNNSEYALVSDYIVGSVSPTTDWVIIEQQCS
jgi:hypothetical protein